MRFGSRISPVRRFREILDHWVADEDRPQPRLIVELGFEGKIQSIRSRKRAICRMRPRFQAHTCGLM